MHSSAVTRVGTLWDLLHYSTWLWGRQTKCSARFGDTNCMAVIDWHKHYESLIGLYFCGPLRSRWLYYQVLQGKQARFALSIHTSGKFQGSNRHHSLPSLQSSTLWSRPTRTSHRVDHDPRYGTSYPLWARHAYVSQLQNPLRCWTQYTLRFGRPLLHLLLSSKGDLT